MKPTAAQLRALAKRDPRLGKVLSKLPPFPGFPVERALPHFHTLARIIIYQQLAVAAANTIHNRVKALSPSPRRFPTAEEFLTLSDEALRAAGLSRNKNKAIKHLAEKTVSGTLGLRSLKRFSDEEVTGRLTSVWGIGEWTAQMFLLFHLGRLDVFAPADLGLLEGIKLLDVLKERPTQAEASARAEVWKPLRSVASWALWRLVDEGEVWES
jgi:3-methyladenine DNA glycosylase/8-oxoguanine DNA glycosylase